MQDQGGDRGTTRPVARRPYDGRRRDAVRSRLLVVIKDPMRREIAFSRRRRRRRRALVTEAERCRREDRAGMGRVGSDVDQPNVGHSPRIGNESVPIQLAQCWFPGLAISAAKIIYFSSKTYGSNFIKQHPETAMV